MSAVQWVIDGLPDGTQKLLRIYVEDVTKAFGDHLDAVLLYGSAVRGDFLPGRSNLNILLFVSSYDVAVLKEYATVHKKWNKELVVAPLFLTKDDLQASAMVFPLEYQDIHDCHRLLWGQDPLVGLNVDQRYLAGEVLQSLRGNLVRLRQRFVEGGGTAEAMLILLALSITAVLPILRGAQRLLDRPIRSQGTELLEDVEACFEMDLSALHDVWLLKRGQISPGQKEVPRLMDRYMDGLARLTSAMERRIGS